MKNWKLLKTESRIAFSEWLMTLAFDVAPETEDGVHLKNRIGKYFEEVTPVIPKEKIAIVTPYYTEVAKYCRTNKIDRQEFLLKYVWANSFDACTGVEFKDWIELKSANLMRDYEAVMTCIRSRIKTKVA